jgi:hypothetical protein
MIPRIVVKKTYKAATGHNLIDPGEPEGMFFSFLITIGIINTHSSIFILFGHKDGIGKPIQVVHFFNETSV